MEKVVEAFNNSEAGKKYEMELQWLVSGTGAQSMRDRMCADFQAGKKDSGFDVMEINFDDVAVYNKQSGGEFFMKLDTSKLSNYSNVLVKPRVAAEYGVPYRATTVGLAYDSARVSNPPKTPDELTAWIKANPGKFAYNPPSTGGAGSSFVNTALYNRISDPAALLSDDPKWKDQWGPGFDYLAEIHPFLYKSSGKVVYPNKNQGTLDLLANKEVDIIPAWADMTISQVKAGTLPNTVKFVNIEPGFTGGVQGIFIPSLSTNVEGAYAVMDHFATAEVQNILLSQMAAIPVIDISKLDPANAALIKDLKLENFRFIALGGLGKEINKLWDEKIATLN
jgi:putative spermidine/putrescine transport system substrate-binding protein